MQSQEDYRRWLKTYDGVVFSGRVTSVEESDAFTRTVRFEVERQWKGVTERQVVVLTPLDGAACGLGFQPKRVYVVAARRTGSELMANLCDALVVNEEKAFRAALGDGSPVPTR
jgi:hypothetical protein